MCTELLRALPDYWLATVTTLLAFFTLWLVIESKDAARKQLGVNTWLHFIERWDSPQMRGERKKLAQAILREESNYDSDPVLDFLEQISTAYLENCLGKKLTYSSFSHDAEHWLFILKGRIHNLRTSMSDESAYEDLENMVLAIRKDHPKDPPVTGPGAHEYLDGEANL